MNFFAYNDCIIYIYEYRTPPAFCTGNAGSVSCAVCWQGYLKGIGKFLLYFVQTACSSPLDGEVKHAQTGGSAVTELQKTIILKLRGAGKSYSEISRTTNLPVGTLKAFCSRSATAVNLDTDTHCEFCRAEITRVLRHKRFCSDQCRYRWWSKNRDKVTTTYASRACVQCKEKYTSYNNESRFCSHPCYIAHRFRIGDKQL